MYSAIHLKFPWVNETPDGFPVVPDVYLIVAISSKSTGANISLNFFSSSHSFPINSFHDKILDGTSILSLQNDIM